MDRKTAFKIIAPLLGIVFALSAPQGAMAANNYTAACSVIANTAVANFTVAGIAQTPQNSTTANFTVGNKVNVSVVTTDLANVTVAPGATGQVMHYNVTNNGNATQRYELTTIDSPSGQASPFAGVDNFDATGDVIYVGGVPATFISTLPPDTTRAVEIHVNIPLVQVDGDIHVEALKALTKNVDGSAVSEADVLIWRDGGTSCAGTLVLADAAGSEVGDNARDGAHSARSAVQVSASQMSFSKTSTTVWDPVNFTTGPKAIPGALVKYVVTISNAAGATSSAVLTTITDGLNANLTIDPDLKVAANLGPLSALANESALGKGFKVTHVSGRTLATPKYYTTTSSADGVDISGQNITATMALALPAEAGYSAGELKPNESVTITFNVTIN